MKVTLILEADSKTLGGRKAVANDVFKLGAAVVALMGCEGKTPELKKKADDLAAQALEELGITFKRTEEQSCNLAAQALEELGVPLKRTEE